MAEVFKKWDQAVMIPIERIQANKWNPQEMSEEKFVELVEEIDEVGFDEPLQVVPIEDGMFRLVSGHNRLKACRGLEFKEVPCVIKEGWTEDKQRLEMIRRNVVKGELDKKKFTNLIDDLTLGQDIKLQYLIEEMGFGSDGKEFYQFYDHKEVEKQGKEFDHESDTVEKVVNHTAQVLNEVLEKHGDTTSKGFIYFMYKGKPHLVVSMNIDLVKQVEDMTEVIKTQNVNVNDFLSQAIFKKVHKSIEKNEEKHMVNEG